MDNYLFSTEKLCSKHAISQLDLKLEVINHTKYYLYLDFRLYEYLKREYLRMFKKI